MILNGKESSAMSLGAGMEVVGGGDVHKDEAIFEEADACQPVSVESRD